MSALTVVAAPRTAKPLKFSSVSFLGPILGENMLRVGSAVHERSALERRYLSGIENLSVLIKEKAGPDLYTEAGLDAGTDIFESDGTLTSLAISAIDGNKTEPGNLQ
ncbi:MAG: hypothetical protein PHV48_05925 [Candidatus Omnitrophica bacterium]|nr:hypothetical protein [Candidatus Omnitrophota bacterium]